MRKLMTAVAILALCAAGRPAAARENPAELSSKLEASLPPQARYLFRQYGLQCAQARDQINTALIFLKHFKDAGGYTQHQAIASIEAAHLGIADTAVEIAAGSPAGKTPDDWLIQCLQDARDEAAR
jgi:hypothetical protein